MGTLADAVLERRIEFRLADVATRDNVLASQRLRMEPDRTNL